MFAGHRVGTGGQSRRCRDERSISHVLYLTDGRKQILLMDVAHLVCVSSCTALGAFIKLFVVNRRETLGFVLKCCFN